MKNLVGLYLNLLTTILLAVSSGLAAILLPTSLEARGLSSTVIGTIMSLQVVAVIAACLFMPYVQRVLGLSLMLILHALLRVPVIVLLSMYGQLTAWAVLILALGSFSALSSLALQRWIGGLSFKRRGLVFALQGTSLSLGTALGPFVFRYADRFAPWMDRLGLSRLPVFGDMDYQLPFLICAAISLLAVIPAVLSPFFTPKMDAGRSGGLVRIIARAQAPMNAIAMAGASYYGVSAFITIFALKSGMQLSDAAICLSFFMLGGICLDTLISGISDYTDRRYMIMGLTMASTVLAIFLPLAIYTPIRAWILLFVWGGVIAALYSVILAMLSERFGEDEQSAVNAAYTLMEGVGGTAGVFLIGVAMHFLGADGFVYVVILANILYFN